MMISALPLGRSVMTLVYHYSVSSKLGEWDEGWWWWGGFPLPSSTSNCALSPCPKGVQTGMNTTLISASHQFTMTWTLTSTNTPGYSRYTQQMYDICKPVRASTHSCLLAAWQSAQLTAYNLPRTNHEHAWLRAGYCSAIRWLNLSATADCAEYIPPNFTYNQNKNTIYCTI